MTRRVRALLDRFDQLSDPEKKILATEIYRRSARLSSPPVSDAEFVHAAEQLFLALDKEESTDA